MGVVIGCDIGTQSTKAVAFDERLAVLARASASHGVRFPAANWAEQDPQEWRAALLDVLADLRAQLGSRAGELTHVALDAQVDGVVAVDAELRPLAPAIIWLDRRAVDERARLESKVGAERIFGLTGLNADSSHGGPKMMWLLGRRHEGLRWLLPPAAAAVAWLSGECVQDHANASSTMLYDVTSRAWSDELLAAADVDPALLARIDESTEIAGALRGDIADRLGFPADCRVLVGTGDDHASALGAGAAAPGVVADVSGTAEPVGVTARKPAFDRHRLVETHAHAVPGQWFIENPGIVSGGAILWVASLLGVDQAQVFALAAEARPGCDGLVFLPALSGAMAPRWNDRAKGSFSGAAMGHGRPEWCRAVLEGCTFAVRDSIDRLHEIAGPVEELRVVGGGSRSALWLQMRADVTGRAVRRVLGEGAATGAACLAAVAAGWFPDVPAASAAMTVLDDRVMEPRTETRAVYEHAYRAYRQTYEALEPTFGEAPE